MRPAQQTMPALSPRRVGVQDGRQAMTGAIGLPSFFMDESKWQLILLVYFGALILGLPIFVWRWYVLTSPVLRVSGWRSGLCHSEGRAPLRV